MKTTEKGTRDKLVEAGSFKGLEDDFAKVIKEFRATFSA
jgi:hypothetical protein